MLLALLHVALAFEWTEGYAPLDFGGDPPRAEACASCHPEQARQWRTSRHAASWHNDLIQVGYAFEPLDFCVNCHAPRPDQRAEIAANRDWYRSLDPRSGIVPGTVARRPEPAAADGIDCAACHWRGGRILGPSNTHPWHADQADDLHTGALCAGCHEFRTPTTTNGVTRPTDLPMQSTATEWRAWRAAGGTQTCIDCHMPGGDHTFRGAHDRELLRASLHVEVSDGALLLRSVGVGHHLPTGDLFRHITVEADAGAGWVEVHRIGRRFDVALTEHGLHKTLAADTSLRPGEARRVVLPAHTARWRVVWHDGAPHDEARGLLDPADITEVLAP